MPWDISCKKVGQTQQEGRTARAEERSLGISSVVLRYSPLPHGAQGVSGFCGVKFRPGNKDCGSKCFLVGM